jgi:hypothetical protein
MDEDQHKALLQQRTLPRLLKTGNAGWLWKPEEVGRAVILVEGKFEKLALVAAGFASQEVIAIGGAAAKVDWLPTRVRTVLLALNGDERGREGARRLKTELLFAGVCVEDCAPPDDQRGTDCSARWRIAGQEGVRYVFDAWQQITCHCECGAEVELYGPDGTPYGCVAKNQGGMRRA